MQREYFHKSELLAVSSSVLKPQNRLNKFDVCQHIIHHIASTKKKQNKKQTNVNLLFYTLKYTKKQSAEVVNESEPYK